MATSDQHHTADMSKHSDEQLEDGVAKADANEPRLLAENKDAAREALQEQRDKMVEELQERG